MKVTLTRWSTGGPAHGSQRVPAGEPREESLAPVLCGFVAGLRIKAHAHCSTAGKHTDAFRVCVHTGIFRKENGNLKKHVYSVWFVRTGGHVPSCTRNRAPWGRRDQQLGPGRQLWGSGRRRRREPRQLGGCTRSVCPDALPCRDARLWDENVLFLVWGGHLPTGDLRTRC